MDVFEAVLKQATTREPLALLGAIGLVVNSNGDVLYHHAGGAARLGSDAPLSPDSTVMLASAGKFITHIAALQLVQRGLIDLDSPVWTHLPELKTLPVLQSNGATVPATSPITLRSLLLHTSGLSDAEFPLLQKFPEAVQSVSAVTGSHPIVQNFSLPLAFQPGEGFAYGASIHWTQLLVTRLADGQSFRQHIQRNIFDPLDMATSTYCPRDSADVWDNRMQMVARAEGTLVDADDAGQGLYCSMLDMGKILSDLIAPASKLLEKKYIELLFHGQLSGPALADLRGNEENYAFCAGKQAAVPPLVNWSMAGLTAEAELPASHVPEGTVLWQGMPNVVWAMSLDRGLATFFATQLLPNGDEQANNVAIEFMRSAWSTFCSDVNGNILGRFDFIHYGMQIASNVCWN